MVKSEQTVVVILVVAYTGASPTITKKSRSFNQNKNQSTHDKQTICHCLKSCQRQKLLNQNCFHLASQNSFLSLSLLSQVTTQLVYHLSATLTTTPPCPIQMQTSNTQYNPSSMPICTPFQKHFTFIIF